MPDPRFFRRAGPFTLGDLAGRADCDLAPGTDPAGSIIDIGALDSAGPGQIIYVSEQRYFAVIAVSKAAACVTTPAFAGRAPAGCGVLIAKDPRAAFAAIAHAFYPDPHATLPRTATIAADAQIAPDAEIAPGAAVGAGASIGAGSSIGANTVVGDGVVIGRACRIAPNVTLSHCLIGDRVILHPGVQIGQDGFGYAPAEGGLRKVPQLGRVVIEDDVEIGANSCVDRGTIGDTLVGAGTKIDNLVQIAHNVQIGRNCVIVSQAGIAGSARLGDGVIVGGQVAIVEHLTIGDGAQIAGKSGVIRDVAPGEVVMGYPAKPIRQFWREIAALGRLIRRS